jgi:hypothetical protein
MPRPPCICTGRPGVRCDDGHCDLAPKGTTYDQAKGHCVICWYWHHDPRYRAAWGGPGTPAPPRPAPLPLEKWPRWAKALAKRRRPGEAGVGDTLERLLRHKGGNLFKIAVKKLTGRDCGCAGRQANLNAEFPYFEEKQ